MVALTLLIVVGAALIPEIDILEFEGNIFSRIYNLFMWLVYVLALLGLYGFVYQKKNLIPDIWKFVFFLVVIETIGETFYTLSEIDFLMMSIVAIITIPHLYALYRYSFSMTELWGNKNG